MAIDPHLVKNEISPYTTMQLANALSNKGLSFDLDKTHINSPFHWLNEIQNSMKNIEANKAVRYLDQLSQDPDKLIQMRNAHSINGNDMYEAYRKQLGNYANFVFGSQTSENTEAMNGKNTGAKKVYDDRRDTLFTNAVKDNTSKGILDESLDTIYTKAGIGNQTGQERLDALASLGKAYENRITQYGAPIVQQQAIEKGLTNEQLVQNPAYIQGMLEEANLLKGNFTKGAEPNFNNIHTGIMSLINAKGDPKTKELRVNEDNYNKNIESLYSSATDVDDFIKKLDMNSFNFGKGMLPTTERHTYITEYGNRRLREALNNNPQLNEKVDKAIVTLTNSTNPTERNAAEMELYGILNNINEVASKMVRNNQYSIDIAPITQDYTKRIQDALTNSRDVDDIAKGLDVASFMENIGTPLTFPSLFQDIFFTGGNELTDTNATGMKNLIQNFIDSDEQLQIAYNSYDKKTQRNIKDRVAELILKIQRKLKVF